MDEDWDVSFLPRDWRELAWDTGTLNGLRKDKTVDNLLRTLLLHLGRRSPARPAPDRLASPTSCTSPPPRPAPSPTAPFPYALRAPQAPQPSRPEAALQFPCTCERPRLNRGVRLNRPAGSNLDPPALPTDAQVRPRGLYTVKSTRTPHPEAAPLHRCPYEWRDVGASQYVNPCNTSPLHTQLKDPATHDPKR